MDGLRPILRRDVRVAVPTTFEVAVSRALAADQDQIDIERDRQVADTLSRKTKVITQLSLQRPLQSVIQQFELAVYARDEALNLATIKIQSTLRDRIQEGQSSNEKLQKWRLRDVAKSRKLYSKDYSIVRYRYRFWVPSGNFLREVIMKEAHDTLYSINPRSTKMYKDLQLLYWWPGMKRDILRFVSECLTCQQVKVGHQRLTGKLKPLPIPE
ncbi:uncharacterized protein LOC142537582 [Primulina tabacum]|uniref:uncharacterized protein LOC142537582 n=1 Tax=Primulina tabacum TaxID=48773 RepID=UPI003F5A6C54